jgi:hypothetical protein
VRRFLGTTAFLVLGLGWMALSGCRPASTDEATPLASAVTTPDKAGASHAQSRLVGRWDGGFQMNSDAPLDEFDELTVNICKSIRMLAAFHADERLEMSATMTLPEIGAQTSETKGKWKILAENGNEVRLQALDPDGDPEEMTVTFLDDHTFVMTPPNELRDLGMLKFTKN